MSVERSMAASSAPTVRTARRQPVEQAPTATVDAAEPILTTHRVTYSDRLKLFIGTGESIDNFLRPLRRLDGHHRFSVQLTRLPAPMRPADITPAISSAPGQNYLRCTGSADALILELHTRVDGAARRCVVGRAGSRDGEPGICVQVPESMPAPWIYPDEVFTAEDAAEIFAGYFHTGTVPPGLALRETAE
ncbi:hypothetical protein [Nocardia suismassiliense]|uniref:hypothetical protein n=1 Tax=Nocardia suismassiliense TaxID=2077092 RepID=UPI00131EEB83|nr:hypothetical protein [Nocardia suismassiliense]